MTLESDLAEQALHAHLATGATTVCRCWRLARRDGVTLGFTDHDEDLVIEGLNYRANTGFSARAFEQTTGLAVNNGEALGALSDVALADADITAGRYDGAEVRVWLVNWRDPAMRYVEFAGTIGEVVRRGDTFDAELRGLTEPLNQPQGRVFQSQCSALLGDRRCGVVMAAPGMSVEAVIDTCEGERVLGFSGLGSFQAGWFTRGRVELLSGAGRGLVGLVKADRSLGASRQVELWQSLRAGVAVGDTVRLEAGCDKRAATCKAKFANFRNFRGFPHIPTEDWLAAYPKQSGMNDGGSTNGAGGTVWEV
ncbi:DUF2163 domain-containing protein [Tropicimonas sp. IMCC34043]|uniref:DUF2163 domain-containing protein n=1 Tax=Tropicimonas sp. IMCC34043 TaxID=2248760 RepID=UPI000E25CEF4|nr:DUF2163 domain-containing protein [Tropicimonas sp. IMCC34043]